MLNIACIGAGYWGPKIIRNFLKFDSVNIAKICDISPENQQKISSIYNHINVTSDISDIMQDSKIQAVSIATPANTHYALVKYALKSGKHVLVEKPLSLNYKEAEDLIFLAKKRNLILFTGYTFIYSGAVKKIKEILSKNDLGEINNINSIRLNTGTFRHDVNVAWDLAIHDLSILYYLLKREPIGVSAFGMKCFDSSKFSVMYITLLYSNTFMAHINVNWNFPMKERRLVITGSKKFLVYDDSVNENKLKIIDKNIRYEYFPSYSNTEPLENEISHFIDCVKHCKSHAVNSDFDLKIIKILEAIETSLTLNGQQVKI